MTYSVRWSRQALEFLADIWLANPDARDEITQAADGVDRLLRTAPDEQGESRDNDRRILFIPPLVVIYRVDESNRTVRILQIRRIRRRGTG